MTDKVTDRTQALLAQAAELEQAKADQVERLLSEREALEVSTEKRLGEIREELRALGWFPPRKPREVKAASRVNSILAAK